MNPEWTRKFIELVKSGASLKAYKRKLGLSKVELQYHLGRLAEYEAALESPVVGREDVVKKVERVKAIIEEVLQPELDEPEELYEPEELDEPEELELTTEETEQEEVEEDEPEDEID